MSQSAVWKKWWTKSLNTRKILNAKLCSNLNCRTNLFMAIRNSLPFSTKKSKVFEMFRVWKNGRYSTSNATNWRRNGASPGDGGEKITPNFGQAISVSRPNFAWFPEISIFIGKKIRLTFRYSWRLKYFSCDNSILLGLSSLLSVFLIKSDFTIKIEGHDDVPN